MTPHPLAGVYEWRGKTYHGLASVAKAAGVNFTTVGHHLQRHGHLDRLGIGSQCGNPLGLGVPGKEISRFGRTWPSIGALARDAGRARGTVKFWLDRGDDDSLLAALMAADARKIGRIAA